MSCSAECPTPCLMAAFDREDTAARVYSVRRHRRAIMLELAAGWGGSA